jgi:predicted phage replisome organizer
MAKRYFWLKLYDNFFGSKRIKILRHMAGGDTYTIIYLKMQLKAMKTDGILKYSGLLSDFAEELAVDIDEEPQNVRVTLAYLLSCGLAETDDDKSYFFPYAVANTGSEGASAARMRKLRGKDASLGDGGVTLQLRLSDGEKEKNLELYPEEREERSAKAENEFSTGFSTKFSTESEQNIEKLRENTLERLRQYREGRYG